MGRVETGGRWLLPTGLSILLLGCAVAANSVLASSLLAIENAVIDSSVIDSSDTQARRALDLPVQPLSQALAQCARIMQTAIVFNPTQLQNLPAPALHGEFNTAEALAMLLQSSGFIAIQRASGWLIQPQPEPGPASPPITAAPEPRAPETLLVLGSYSHSQAAALQQKRASNQLVERIIAADIAKFPAQNIAEAIQRNPGISVVRDRGEALFLSIRGLPTQFNRVSLNGHNLTVNENVRNSEQYGRRFHYDTFPAELVAGVTVVKSASANQQEGAIGGSVNLHSFAPLTLGETQFTLNATTNSAELVGDWQPRLSALSNWVNAEQTLGLMFASAYTQRSTRQDRALNFRWQAVPPTSDPLISTTAAAPLFTPAGLRPTLELEERERLGISSAIQWRPGDQFQLDLSWLDLQQQIKYHEFSYSADYKSEDLLTGTTMQRGAAIVAGATNSGSVQIGRESAGLEDNNQMLDIKLTWEGKLWRVDGSGASGRASSGNPEPIKRTRLRREQDVSFRFDYPDGNQLPALDYQNIDLQNPADFPGRRLEWRITHSNNREDSATLNATRRLEHPWLASIKTGLQWRDNQRDYWRKDRLVTEGIYGVYFPLTHFEAMPVDDFLQASDTLPGYWLVPDENAFWQTVDEVNFYRSAFTNSDLQNNYTITETTRAAYLKLDIEHTGGIWPLRGDLGVRWVTTAQQAQGFRPQQNAAAPVSFSQNYQQLLPSANLVWDVGDNVLWRSALAKVMARPEYQDLAPRLTLNSGDLATATGGNPALKPVTGWQWDSALEYYVEPNGLISAGIFVKKLNNFFQTRTRISLINGQQYELTTPDNGASAQVAGLELAWQQQLPEPLRHWGFAANYTRTHSRATYLSDTGKLEDSLADVAKNSINLSLYRESDHWDWRAHYSWRDQVLNQIASANLAAQNIEPFGSLDMHGAWHINPQITLTAEVTNLTNAAQWESVSGGEFAGYTHYGRSFWLGVRMDF